MKLNPKEIRQKANQAIRNVLQRIPDLTDIRVQQQPQSMGGIADLLVTFRRKNDDKLLLADVKSSGQPRYARNAVNSLLIPLAKLANGYGVFIAPYISRQSAEICQQANIGYIDFSGNCRLSFDSTYIEITGNPNPFSEKRVLKTLFKPKAERILRTLLCEPRKVWLTGELAKIADVSLGQVSNVRKLLLEREWITDNKRGIALTEPLQLLEAWRENYQSDRNACFDFYFMKPVPEIELLIGNICKQTKTRYALTGFSGASRYAPFTTYKTVTLYMDPPPSIDKDVLPFTLVSSGANIRILSPYDAGVFTDCRNIHGDWVASPIQCYLDLKDEKARGQEAADVLLEKEIKPTWQ